MATSEFHSEVPGVIQFDTQVDPANISGGRAPGIHFDIDDLNDRPQIPRAQDGDSVLALSPSSPLSNHNSRKPPAAKILFLRLVKYLPLTLFAILLAIVASLSVELTAPKAVDHETDDDDYIVNGHNIDLTNECLRKLQFYFLGSEALRLPERSPQKLATEWLAVEDDACSYLDLDLNSTRMEQRFALLTLYYGLSGLDWGFSGWGTRTHECDWENVWCNSTDGFVTDIQLRAGKSYNAGQLPEEIGLLSSLTNLDLSDGRIGGTIPMSIYSLTNLETLDISGNSMFGTIASTIGSLTKLKRLRILRNQLSGSLPDSLSSLSHMSVFNLGNTNFEGDAWKFIVHWPELVYFIISNTEGLGGRIPSEIGKLTNLLSIDLEFTITTGSIPTEIGNLDKLKYLVSRRNQLNGTVPSELGRMTELLMLTVDDNLLSGTIPTEIGLCTKLSTLKIGENDISGTLPSELGLLTELREFNGEATLLKGTIPDTFGNLINLEILDFVGVNTLSGTLPPSICSISDLSALNMPCSVTSCTCCQQVGLFC